MFSIQPTDPFHLMGHSHSHAIPLTVPFHLLGHSPSPLYPPILVQHSLPGPQLGLTPNGRSHSTQWAIPQACKDFFLVSGWGGFLFGFQNLEAGEDVSAGSAYPVPHPTTLEAVKTSWPVVLTLCRTRLHWHTAGTPFVCNLQACNIIFRCWGGWGFSTI